MIILLSILVVLLLIVILLQTLSARKHSRQLDYIHDKLERILEQGSQERLLMMSDSPQVQQLLTDLNRLMDINYQGAAQRARLEKSMRSMLANVSHDLKTPLTVVLGYIETLLHDETVPAEEQQHILRTIHAKAGEVISLMNRFFDLAKLESGDREITLSRIELGEVCRRNILAFYDLLSAKGAEVEIEIPDEPLYIMGNDEALDRVLSNLLSNSINYGDAGGVLGLKLYTDAGRVCIEVWDRGKGIAEGHEDKVFERLYTLEDSRNREYQGSGLGLTISKRLTEHMNGTITVSSKPYVRTAFTLSFPRQTF